MRIFFTTLVLLLAVNNTAYGQDERAPRRPEGERPERIERPEPNRQSPPPVIEQRKAEPRPVEPQRPVDRPPMGPPGVRPTNPPVVVGGPCWNRWECRGMGPWIGLELEFNNRQRMDRNRRPPRARMVYRRNERLDNLTEKQKTQLFKLRQEFIKKRQRILNNP